MGTIISKVGIFNVASCDLNDVQHDIVCDMIANDKTKNGNYTIELVDDTIVDVWAEDDDNENKEFYQKYKNKFADFYTLYDNLGDFKQPIGDIAVW